MELHDDTRRGHGLRTGGLVLGVLLLLVVVPACSSPPTPTTAPATTSTSTSTSSPPVTFQQGSAAEVASCQSDAKVLEVALEAYMAEKGSFPSPPAPWSAATYAADFQPLLSSGGGGPFIPKPPGNQFYVIEYDSAGHVWVAPPGSYEAAYDPGQSFDANPNVCLAAVG